MARQESVGAQLRRFGFTDPKKAERLLADPTLSKCVTDLGGLNIFEKVGDPDLALLSLIRLVAAQPEASQWLGDSRELVDRVLAIFGASKSLGDMIIANPTYLSVLAPEKEKLASRGSTPVEKEFTQNVLKQLLDSVGVKLNAHGQEVAAAQANSDDLRRCYRGLLLQVAAADLQALDPIAQMDQTGAWLSALADGALRAGLALARRDCDPEGKIDFTVIALGKTGGQELNYISDVDVIYVCGANKTDTQNILSENEVIALATRIGVALAQCCSGAGNEPPLWPLDTNLRPEGKDGALVRTLDSYASYYRRWAQTWEFQALLKARIAAGSTVLGEEFLNLISPLVWSAAQRERFVEDCRTMRQRVESAIPLKALKRQLKLGPGGLRDVEFTVQLLQLVHGRTDENLRVGNTLKALEVLTAGGYVGRKAGKAFAQCYRFLRTLEHRAQLFRMTRTHMVPTANADLRRIGRTIDQKNLGDFERMEARWLQVRKEVRTLHEEVFYRPLLPATARLNTDEVTLSEDGVRQRLAAIGYRDTNRAVQHIKALTAGLSRRAQIQRHLLPVILGWLANGADPDAGLFNFRLLSEQIGDSHWYMGFLRDSGAGAERLCKILPNSSWVAQQLREVPQAVKWLDEKTALNPREKSALEAQMWATAARHDELQETVARLSEARNLEIIRAAIGDVLEEIDSVRAGKIIVSTTEVLLDVCLENVKNKFRYDDLEISLIGMGRFGGAESGYGSDADLLAVYGGMGTDTQLAAQATEVIQELISALSNPALVHPLQIDMGLRPEGKNGAMVRSLASYREYYQRWLSPWERQALLRARVVGGNRELGEQFIKLIDPIRYPEQIDSTELREIRRLKARMERERLPRSISPVRHVKLGPGWLSDVEWVIQMLQLQHGHRVSQLRTTSTIRALEVAHSEQLLATDDYQQLVRCWKFATRIRAALVLVAGPLAPSKADTMPRAGVTQLKLARLLGYRAGREWELEEDFLRNSRLGRAVVERLFFH